jgi:hypothetical protein
VQTGTGRPLRAHIDAAASLANQEGARLYREKNFTEALKKYAEAARISPAFLAPRLNRACAFSRLSRFEEAATEAADLVATAYVPWHRDVLEATDLAPLATRPEMFRVKKAAREAAFRWGAEVSAGVLLVVRQDQPLATQGDGVFIHGPQQEIFSWNPRNGGYHQVTAEDGRVLAFVRSPDAKNVLYLRANKLVRTAGKASAFRGLSARTLVLSSMTLGAPVDLPGDLEAVHLFFDVRGRPGLSLTPPGGPVRHARLAGARLEPGPPPEKGPRLALTRLDLRGTPGGFSASRDRACSFELREFRARAGIPQIQVRPQGPAFVLDTPHGAALFALPVAAP